MNFIYSTADEKLERQLLRISNLNQTMDISGVPAFLYKGNIYCPKGVRVNDRPKMLNRVLFDQMQAYTHDIKELEIEKNNVSNYISCLLLPSCNTEDLYNLFPEFLHPALKVTGLPKKATLSFAEVQKIKNAHKEAPSLIKKRMILNLIS